MKLNTNQKSLESSGMNINVDFSIDMNGKAFSVLSDGMYSKIIPTIVRELSSNAYDAHVAAKKSDVPFEVSCPNGFDPYFSVKDYGTGLRYFSYNARIVNEHEGESTIFINGDIRKSINNINLIVLDSCNTVRIGAILYDNSAKQTVIRIPGDYEGENVSVEFDDALVLYSTYFRSTKEQSNDYIGAFGLGSKTPFAYTDNFLVINRFNGVQRIYNILTNQDSKPQINLMSSDATTEPNGLEVKLAVSPDDHPEFKSAIQNQLVYFNPRPVICNEPVMFTDIVHQGKYFLLMGDTGEANKRGYYHRYVRAVVGNNAYELENRIRSTVFNHNNIVLRFSIGEVSVTASREELKYDDTTIKCINKREKEALAEYTKYVLDSIDSDGMTDYEKAEFINQHRDVINLDADDVKTKVGNSQYRYGRNSIEIPIAGWGDFVELHYDDVIGSDSNGVAVVTGKTINTHKCRYNAALKWSRYQNTNGRNKTESCNDEGVWPNKAMLVFIRDSGYSFLRKIAHYLENNTVTATLSNIFVLDFLCDDDMTDQVLESLQHMIGHMTTFVRLSGIELPKNISYTPTDRNPTPVARICDVKSDTFESVKMWKDIYTPLTQIDTNAYVMSTHRCEPDISFGDQKILQSYFRGGFSYDPNITILAMSRTKYAKALEYGFKPITDLVAEMKAHVAIPVDLMNAEILVGVFNTSYDRAIDLFMYFDTTELKRLNKNSPVTKLIRIKKIIEKRYIARDNKFVAIKELMRYYSDAEKPSASDFAVKAVDKIRELCDNVHKSMILLGDTNGYYFNKPEKKNALIDYVNMIYPNNTGEKNE